ncbi:anaerobic ribonucleoside-triphosphate reductase activating protein [uncultured Acetatifactor sp.]|uniref:anaerobic ribonucleoside-triphosphate reductase activating protein n=1 Tax=uncultured Acetatifactor sp. TaxID=1671927 RepID=UPI00262B83AF|nr:anaerobic ribonucleoside-triphosphate reductase activating protein [uncultured Acetatifactor sp.]
MNYATIKKTDVANGPGIRVSLFVSGCRHRCRGCFNSEAWDFRYGREYTKETEEEILEALAPEHIRGLSLLGGEPMEPENRDTVLSLVEKVRQRYPGKDIWCYTGYDYEKDLLQWIEQELSGNDDGETVRTGIHGLENAARPESAVRNNEVQQSLDVDGKTKDKHMFEKGDLEDTPPGQVARLLSLIDVLVDGEFREEEKNLRLAFRGSENQRLIDVKESRRQGRVVCLEKRRGESADAAL